MCKLRLSYHELYQPIRMSGSDLTKKRHRLSYEMGQKRRTILGTTRTIGELMGVTCAKIQAVTYKYVIFA